MKRVIILHGAYGHPDENWIPWLKQELEKLGLEVTVPKLPTPDGQSLTAWREAFRSYEQLLSPDCAVVAHSISVAFTLDLLEGYSVDSAYFIAGFLGLLGIGEVDKINSSISDRDFDWASIRAHCGAFTLFQSDDDPYVPLSKARALANKLQAPLTIVPGAGHFNEAAGYIEFPQLLDAIKVR